ncbi:MAG: hypothetical protein J6B12_03140 [Clostridia bacterium]|nr:hypothetical protein [Clostridia bacterium]
MKKIVAILLLLVMMLGAVSCGGDKVETPKGFQLASVDSAPFYLYVPNTWTSNASSGISSAYCATANGSVLVSAFAQKDERDIALELYTAKTLESFQRTLEGFEMTSKLESAILGSYAAYSFDYKTTADNKEMHFRTYVSDYAEGFAVLTYSADATSFETYEADFAEIVAKFTFKVENEEPVKDREPIKEVIDGWQLASSTKYEYSLYVPKSWTVDKSSEIPTAYRSLGDGDNSNVTLMSYVLTEPMTAGQYWEKAQAELIYDYTVISTDENATLGGLSAFAVEYETGLVGMMYHVKQVFCATSNMVYVFTFTSDENYYSQHLSAVNEMLNMFTFK